MPTPLCFVWIPAGRRDEVGVTVDFDDLYARAIAPAIASSGLEPYRPPESGSRSELQEFLLAEYAIAAGGSRGVALFYGVGLRQSRARPTVLLQRSGSSLSGDELFEEITVSFAVTAEGKCADAAGARRLIEEKLRSRTSLSPAALLESLERPLVPDAEHSVTDRFRKRTAYSAEWSARLEKARSQGTVEAVHRAEKDLDPAKVESEVLIDLLLSYRAVGGFQEMSAVVSRMPPPLARTTLVQQQLGFALNRAGDSEGAARVLEDVIERRGPSSETCGLLGRVYKDRWEAASKAGEDEAARSLLDEAIGAYLEGFESDWRDTYPGINALTLMEVREPPDERRARIGPVVLYAAESRVAAGEPDYWDQATLLEAAVLARDPERAEEAAAKALTAVRESWEPETTARNLRLIREARERRGESQPWAREIEERLASRARR